MHDDDEFITKHETCASSAAKKSRSTPRRFTGESGEGAIHLRSTLAGN